MENPFILKPSYEIQKKAKFIYNKMNLIQRVFVVLFRYITSVRITEELNIFSIAENLKKDFDTLHPLLKEAFMEGLSYFLNIIPVFDLIKSENPLDTNPEEPELMGLAEEYLVGGMDIDIEESQK